MPRLIPALVILAVGVVLAPAGAQGALRQGPAQSAAPGAPPPPAPSPQGDVYAYQPDGRRDPFVNPLNTGADVRPTGKRGDGPAGLAVNEIVVRGVMESRAGMVAMIQAPDKKTYLVHQGDKLLDGTIKTITQQGLVVSQEVNDPLSVVKQREVRKQLRSLEGGKE